MKKLTKELLDAISAKDAKSMAKIWKTMESRAEEDAIADGPIGDAVNYLAKKMGIKASFDAFLALRTAAGLSTVGCAIGGNWWTPWSAPEDNWDTSTPRSVVLTHYQVYAQLLLDNTSTTEAMDLMEKSCEKFLG